MPSPNPTLYQSRYSELERQISELAKTFEHLSCPSSYGEHAVVMHGAASGAPSVSSTAYTEDDTLQVPYSALSPGVLRHYSEVRVPEPLLLASQRSDRQTLGRAIEGCQHQNERYAKRVEDLGDWFHFNEDLIATDSSLRRILTSHPLPPLATRASGRSSRATQRFSALDLEAAGVAEHKEASFALARPVLYGPLRSWLIRFGFYKAMVVLTIAANFAAFIAVLVMGHVSYAVPGTATTVNLMVAILVRHEHCINTVFRVASWLPLSAPLRLRSLATRISINNGGVHIGTAVSGVIWFVYYMVLLNLQFEGTLSQQNVISYLTAALLFDFLLILCFALPSFRQRYHDLWEISHRFGGWTAVSLFWALTTFTAVTVARTQSAPLAQVLLRMPSFWCLIIISYCLVYPWLHLRRHTLYVEKLSDHATRLWFGSRTPGVCVGTRIATHPLTENHGFATIANTEGTPSGFSVIVSNAGDFTKKIIKDPPKRIWTRGAKTTGVLRLISLFRPVVIVATGSGIGPCMSYFQPRPNHPVRIIWSAPSPEKTFGQEILRSVLKADPRAVIIDTKKTGRPDLVGLTWSVAQQGRAEAVFIVSNPVVTTLVMDEIQLRGLLVYGPVFDS